MVYDPQGIDGGDTATILPSIPPPLTFMPICEEMERELKLPDLSISTTAAGSYYASN
jgi:hypothetical protein